MADFIYLMHNDTTATPGDWGPYIGRLRTGGHLEGGSAIGAGVCARKSGAAPPVSERISGYMRIQADDIDHAWRLLAGNPVFEAGGTVEIRELPRS